MTTSASQTSTNRAGTWFDSLAPYPSKGAVFCNGDIHPNRTLRLDAAARYLQDLGFDHLEANGAAQVHPLWVVRRTVIDVIRPITWPGTVRLHRWCSALSSRWCTMRVRIESDGGGLIETEGFWININPGNGMPSRISDDFLAPLAKTTDEHRLTWHRWIPDASAGHCR